MNDRSDWERNKLFPDCLDDKIYGLQLCQIMAYVFKAIPGQEPTPINRPTWPYPKNRHITILTHGFWKIPYWVSEIFWLRSCDTTKALLQFSHIDKHGKSVLRNLEFFIIIVNFWSLTFIGHIFQWGFLETFYILWPQHTFYVNIPGLEVLNTYIYTSYIHVLLTTSHCGCKLQPLINGKVILFHIFKFALEHTSIYLLILEILVLADGQCSI